MSRERIQSTLPDSAANASAPTGAPRASTRWCLRVAGGLLVVGGSAVLISYFLPWTYTSVSNACSTCVPKLHAPADYFWDMTLSFMFTDGGQFIFLIWMAIVIGLPVAWVVLGIRVLAWQQAVRLRWTVLAIVASVLSFGSAYFLAFLMTLSYVFGTPMVHTETGEYLALLAPLTVLAASIVIPRKQRSVS
jgi:hypothetical protein